jgi:hypothetical protein
MAADGVASISSTTRGYDGEGRIDALHDDLLRHIIAWLPVTDGARTAALASRWRHLWRSTLPVLDDARLPQLEHAAGVARVLTVHRGPFRAVRLRQCRFDSLDRELANWPRLLSAKGTQELALFNKAVLLPHLGCTPRPRNSPKPMRLPSDILRCTSLQCLSLAFWKLPDGLSGVLLPHLRTLELIGMGMTELHLDCLLAASPVLHTLTLACIKDKRVHLRSQSLRCLRVGLSGTEDFAVVDAPLLESLVLLDTPVSRGCVVDIACADNLRVLGYLDTRVHNLYIGGKLIWVCMATSPSLPSPNIYEINQSTSTIHHVFFNDYRTLTSYLICPFFLA